MLKDESCQNVSQGFYKNRKSKIKKAKKSQLLKCSPKTLKDIHILNLKKNLHFHNIGI